MKKNLILLLIASLSLIGFQAAAQDNKSDNRDLSINMSRGVSTPAGPRYEIVSTPDNTLVWFKIDKETGEVWAAMNNMGTTAISKMGKEATLNDEAPSGKINYQLIVLDDSHVLLLNIHTGTTWECYRRPFSNFGDFKKLWMD